LVNIPSVAGLKGDRLEDIKKIEMKKPAEHQKRNFGSWEGECMKKE
jgi:hypothetical protein